MKLRTAGEYIGLTLGCAVTALALVLFLIPNKIAAGGVSGFATVIFYVANIPVGLTMLAVNIPLFIMGFRRMGMSFGIKGIYGAVALSFAVDFFNPRLEPITTDPLLASLYGGILVGVGLGIVHRSRATTGGTDLAAQLMSRSFKISIGQSLLIIDFLVIAFAGIVFNIELALYALLSLFATSKMIDLIQEGVGYVKAAYIISNKTDEIAKAIVEELDRGGTVLKGEGIYTGEERNMLMSVVSRTELSQLKELVHQIDPHAFVVVGNVHEALGEGFKKIDGHN
ncbi:uncharacterized membrane-anchored protein YitT (DUF2179 family) [Desulfitispora alkaliphila]|uniref:YitT family protein n=1 Tax=Desulfitispora alkaliphila TaxID=622674 RepID=UPI003D2314BF